MNIYIYVCISMYLYVKACIGMYIYMCTCTCTCICICIHIHITKGSLLAGYLEFYFAKQRGGLDPLSLNDQEKGTPPLPLPPLPPQVNSRHMPCASLHAAAPSQCLVIITIIINIIIILLITIIIRLEIRIFGHPFSKYPTVR